MYYISNKSLYFEILINYKSKDLLTIQFVFSGASECDLMGNNEAATPSKTEKLPSPVQVGEYFL